MKNSEIEELKNKSEGELFKLLQENRDKLRNLKFDLAAGKVKNVTELRSTKKLIARLLTFMNQKSPSIVASHKSPVKSH